MTVSSITKGGLEGQQLRRGSKFLPIPMKSVPSSKISSIALLLPQQLVHRHGATIALRARVRAGTDFGKTPALFLALGNHIDPSLPSLSPQFS